MIFDTITIICCATALILTLLSIFSTPFLRILRPLSKMRTEENEDEAHTPPLSIILYSHDQAQELERNLPLFLQQEYEGDYKVVVIIDKGDTESEDVMKRNAHEPRLYTTYIPNTSRYMSRKKLAITVGVKAAQTDWVIVTEPTCRPADTQWLKGMAAQCTPDKNLVVNYTAYDEDEPAIRRFYHLLTESYLLRAAHKKIAFSTDSPCVAFRKEEFIHENGFLGNLQFNCGEYSSLVNKYAHEGMTSVCLNLEHPLTEDIPSKKTWVHKRLCYNAIRSSLMRRHAYRGLWNIDMALLHISMLVNLLLITYSAIVHNWIVLVVSSCMLLSWLITHTVFCKKAAHRMGVALNVFRIMPMYLLIIWYDLLLAMRFRSADKNDFTTHKL